MEFNNTTKNLLLDYDFEFFLKKNIAQNNYTQENLDTLYQSYSQQKNKLVQELKTNKKQFRYFLEGQVRKGVTGGLIPSLFHLNDQKKLTIFRFEDFAVDWAYFDVWKQEEKKKRRLKRIWDYLVKGGSLLAYLLSFIKLIEYLFPLFIN